MALRFYPTPSSTTYYINEFLIDDMYRVDFNRRVQHQPIWGYDSKKWDFVAKGKEMVTGNLILNFRYPGYLRNVVLANQLREAQLDDFLKAKLGGFGIETEEGVPTNFFVANTDFDNVNTVEAKMKVIADIMAGDLAKSEIAPQTKPSVLVKALKANLEKRFFLSPHGVKNEDTTQYSSVLDQDEIMPFSLAVRYGFRGTAGGFTRYFEDVIILGEGQTVSASAGAAGDMSSSAQALLEVYPFVCRTLTVKRNTT